MDIEKIESEKALLDLLELEKETELLIQSVKGKSSNKSRDSRVRNTLKAKPKDKKKVEGQKADKNKAGSNILQFSSLEALKSTEVVDDEAPDLTPRDDEPIIEKLSDDPYNTIDINGNESAFMKEKRRLSLGEDTFIPRPGLTVDDVEKERRRLQEIEDSRRTAQLISKRAGVTSRPDLNNIKDHSAVKIQSTYRGYLGRKKYILCQRLDQLTKDSDIENDWIEVRDRASGDCWYYNKTTGVSQWERPQEMKANLASKSKLKLLPIQGKVRSASSSSIVVADAAQLSSEENLDPVLRSQSFQAKSNTGKTLLKSLKPKSKLAKKYSKQDVDAHREMEILMGIDKMMPEEKLITPEGTFKPQLRTIVLDTLLESKFDSIASVIAEGSWINNNSANSQKLGSNNEEGSLPTRSLNRNKPMVSVLKLNDKKSNKSALNIESHKKITKLNQLTINEVLPPGFDSSENVTIQDYMATSSDISDSSNENPSAIQSKPPSICFACWSSGNKSCSAHANPTAINGRPRPAESMLLCRNWDLTVMQRRYRSEEIQEIFMKKSTALTYDTRRKKFSTVEEFRHIIYRLLKHSVSHMNYSVYINNRVKCWMLSLVEVVSSQTNNHSRIDDSSIVAEQAKAMKNRRSRHNMNFIIRTCQDIKLKIPSPPITGYTLDEKKGNEQYLFKVSDPCTGYEVELINITPHPVSSRLYAPREYHLPIPRNISLPKLSYSPEALQKSVLPVNTFIDSLLPHAWFERLITSIAREGISNAISHVQDIAPEAALSNLRSAKYPPPSSVKYGLIGRKPMPDMLSVGGLPMEMLVYQIVNTYYPPQYGSFVVMDKSVVTPGVSPETQITFISLNFPPFKPEYIYRPVEHPLNYRRAPTIAIHTMIPEKEHEFIDNKFFYGKNRPEQTGEQDYHGFRTSVWIRHLDIYEETDPLAFIPGADIVTFNQPGANKSNTTHADLTYPFCEPSTKDNSTLDFYHLLLSGVHSFSKPQIFTALSVQEPGQFLKESKDYLPMGYLIVSIYRSWAFVQREVIEEFQTDDGVPYWYHRRTGQTFWERPLYDDETISPLLGGTILDIDNPEEPTLSRQSLTGVNRRYLQGEFRKTMIAHHESDREAIRRRWNAAYAAEKARDRGDFGGAVTDGKIQVAEIDGSNAEIARLVQQRQDISVMNAVTSGSAMANNLRHEFTSNEFSMMENTSGLMEYEINAQKNKMTVIPDNTAIFAQNSDRYVSTNQLTMSNDKTDLRIQTNELHSLADLGSVGSVGAESFALGSPRFASNQQAKADNQVHNTVVQNPVAAFNPQMLSSITESISKMMTQVDTANPQDMIQLGLGMGMAIMQGAVLASAPQAPIVQQDTQSLQSSGYQGFGSPSSFVSATTITAASNNNSFSPQTNANWSNNPNAMTAKSHRTLMNPFSPTMPQIPESTAMMFQQMNESQGDKIERANNAGLRGPEPIGLPRATVSTSINKKLDHGEEVQQRQELNNQAKNPLTTLEKARKLKVAGMNEMSNTPDLEPLNKEVIDFPQNADERIRSKVPVLMFPELATQSSVGVPPEAMTHASATKIKGNGYGEIVDPNSKIKLQKHVLQLPAGFHEAIFASHVAKQEADYLPQVPNLPQTRTVGRVKPRSAALDWIAISFDPWSAGKQPVNSEFVPSLSANANKFFDGDSRAVDAIEMLRHETIADAFTNVEDTEGQLLQRADISRAQVMAQDFKKICSLCRHNKYSEVEQLINQPDWTLPIDYQDDVGNTLLHIAAQNGNKRMIKIFMRRGIKLDTQNLQGQTALHYLFGYGYTDVGEYLVKKGANDDIKNKDGLTCYEGLGARELALL